jgi:hypothetical protein
VDSSASAVASVTAAVTIDATSVDLIWDELITGAAHTTNNSAGKRLRLLAESGSYAEGAVWLDTVNGTAGTADFENGTEVNPTDTIADANTIAASVGLSRFRVLPGASVTFGAVAQSNQTFSGSNWTLALGTVTDFSGTHIEGAAVSGVAAGVGTTQVYEHCIVGATSHIKGTIFRECSITGTQTIIEAGDYRFVHSVSGVAGAGSPTIDMGVAVGASTLELRDWRGGITLNNIAAGDVITLDGIFGTITLNGADGQVEIRGLYKQLTNNLTGSPTVNDAAANVADILADTNELQTDDVPGLIGALNDIAATDIVSGGAITTSAGLAEANVQSMSAQSLTATAIDTGAFTAAKFAANSLDGKGDWLLASSAPTNWSSLVITVGGAVDSLTQGYLDTLLTETTPGRIAGNIDTFFENADAATAQTVDDVGGGSIPTVGQIADAVWDEEITVGHVIADSAGAKLNSAASAGDPWSVALPGAYSAGTAGQKIGDMTYSVANQLDANALTTVAGNGIVGSNEIKGRAYTFFVQCYKNGEVVTNPTLATGDVTISKDGGAFANLATLPVVAPAGGNQVQVDLSATEMNADEINIEFLDAAGAEWDYFSVNILTDTGAIISGTTTHIGPAMTASIVTNEILTAEIVDV